MSHPDYPSITSLTDTLDKFHIHYKTIQVEKNRLRELQFPMLAHTLNGDENFEIKKSFSDANNDETFLDNWDGLALFITSKGRIEEQAQNVIIKKTPTHPNWVLLITALGFLFLSPSLIHFNIYSFVFSLLSVIGIGVCTSIVVNRVKKEAQLIEDYGNADLCIDEEGGLQSEVHLKEKEVTLEDKGLIYFASVCLAQFIAIITNNIPEAFTLLIIPVILSLAISSYFFYANFGILKPGGRKYSILLGLISLQAIIVVLYMLSAEHTFSLIGGN
jgi:hypothetical protein